MGTRRILTSGALGLAALCLAGPAGAGADFNVVVNQKNPVTSLTASDLKRVISGGTKVWDGAGVVQLGVIPSDAPETQYLAATLETTPRELLALLQQQVFKGELKRPVVLRSSADCVAFAASNPGGICVAAASVPIPAGAHAVPIR
jgi:hypothetical protein